MSFAGLFDWQQRCRPITFWALLALTLGAIGLAYAAAPAGSTIGNQASATYSDDSSVTRTVTSNTVVTIVQQVASLTLSANGSRTSTAGGQVTYPHTLTNTGNGSDTFTLGASNTSGTFNFSSVQVYADSNGDGIADTASPITSTGVLAAGDVFKFVVVGTVPSTAVSGNTNVSTVTATSTFNNTVSTTNTDTTTITSQAVVNMTYGIDVTSGASPSGPRTFTLTYTNTGNTAATNLTITDVIPSGFTYVAASGRWSVTGSGVVLTDANAADNQSGIVYDFGVTQGSRITAVIASIPAGSSGTLTFQANVNSGLAPGANPATASTANYTYNDGASTIGPVPTNTVQFTVAQSASVTVSAATVNSVVQGAPVNFTSTITNTGNGTDTFNLSIVNSTFPPGTTFQILDSTGTAPLTDSNGDGIPDTGPRTAGSALNVTVRAILPANATGGPYTAQLRATSVANPSNSGTGLLTLSSITAAMVDLTNNTAGSGSPGFGAGPEGAAAVTNNVAPSGTTRFTLVVANNSGVADSYNLQASTDVSFATQVVPAGWSVVFRDSNNAIISATGIIAAGANRTVFADVTAPASASTGFNLHFRAISPSSGVLDRLFDAVTVSVIRSLTLSPNHTGQTTPGGIVTYTHVVRNTGNVLEGDGVASTGNLSVASSAGFPGTIYWDRNNDNVLDPNDPVVSTLAQLTGGSNGASTAAGLSPNESATLFVRVSSPPGAASGAIDTTTLTVTVTGVISGAAAPSAVSVNDVTTIVTSQLTIATMQSLDANCDGTSDSGTFSASPIVTGAVPGSCIRYQVTATNAGSNALSSVVVSNDTPSYTTYHATVPAAVTVGSIGSTPAGGAAGTITANVGTMTPSQSAVLTFGVRINP